MSFWKNSSILKIKKAYLEGGVFRRFKQKQEAMGGVSSSIPSDQQQQQQTHTNVDSSPNSPIPSDSNSPSPKMSDSDSKTPKTLGQDKEKEKALEDSKQSAKDSDNVENKDEGGDGDEGDEDEEEEGECGFCVFMKGGGCKDSFVAWEKCIEEAEKSKEDIVDKCAEITTALTRCMEAHADYYEPIIRAEKKAKEEVIKELENEKEREREKEKEKVEVASNWYNLMRLVCFLILF